MLALKTCATTFLAEHEIAVDPEVGCFALFHCRQRTEDSRQDSDACRDDFWSVVDEARVEGFAGTFQKHCELVSDDRLLNVDHVLCAFLEDFLVQAARDFLQILLELFERQLTQAWVLEIRLLDVELRKKLISGGFQCTAGVLFVADICFRLEDEITRFSGE